MAFAFRPDKHSEPETSSRCGDGGHIDDQSRGSSTGVSVRSTVSRSAAKLGSDGEARHSSTNERREHCPTGSGRNSATGLLFFRTMIVSPA